MHLLHKHTEPFRNKTNRQSITGYSAGFCCSGERKVLGRSHFREEVGLFLLEFLVGQNALLVELCQPFEGFEAASEAFSADVCDNLSDKIRKNRQ